MVPSSLSVRGAESAAPGLHPTFGEIVVVSPNCERFDDVVAAAAAGEVGLHFCVGGRSALRMARRFRADVWLVSLDLPDMSGLDLLEMLVPIVAGSGVDPLLGGIGASLGHVEEGLRPGVFAVATRESIEDEQRTLRAGAAGYLAGPVSVAVLRQARLRRSSTSGQVVTHD